MPKVSRVTVDRILGRYDDTVITVTEHGGDSSHGHASSHTSVNSAKTYSVAFEAGGKTYKFTDSDHIILEKGDRIKIVWMKRDDGLLIVEAMINESRSITRSFRVSVVAHFIMAVTVASFAILICVVSSDPFDADNKAYNRHIAVFAVAVVALIYAAIAAHASRTLKYARKINFLLKS